MPGKIYLIHPNQKLEPMTEQAYAKEHILQDLLEKYPDLLAGEQINPISPRRWLLVSREVNVPGDEEGGKKWSLDHLFLDQDAVPTLVEVKRASDTRIRREVVGQMLDYAANAVVYWPLTTIRAMFENTCQNKEQDPDQLIADFLETGFEDHNAIEQFWGKVKTNLQAGKVRLVFVADQIPPELQRIVEFLNEQMDPAEVLAVELHQYVSGEIKTLVPKVIGQTAEAQRKSSSGGTPARKWNPESFMQEITDKHPDCAGVVSKILDWAQNHPAISWIYWGEGATMGGFVPIVKQNGKDYQLFAVYTNGKLEVYFQHYKGKPPFNSEAKRLELLKFLNAIPGIKIPEDAIGRRPSLELNKFQNPQVLQALLDTFEWVAKEAINFKS
jgi:hypothetical protein